MAAAKKKEQLANEKAEGDKKDATKKGELAAEAKTKALAVGLADK